MATFQPIQIQPRMPPRLQGTIALDSLNQELDMRNYTCVLKSQELFKNLFYKANVNNSTQSEDGLKTDLVGSKIKVIGNDPIIEAIERAIECIRNAVLEAVQAKRSLTIYPIDFACDIKYYFDRDQQDGVLVWDDWTTERRVSIFETIHKDYIQPNLSEMFNSLRIDCAFKTKEVRTKHKIYSFNKDVEIIEIKPKKGEFLTYPIPPKKTEEHAPLDLGLYSMYEKGEDCDLTLVANDGKVQLHKVILKLRGGDVFKAMFRIFTKESEEQRIELIDNQLGKLQITDETAESKKYVEKGFSKETLEAFVDYLYLGAHALEEKIASRDEFDFMELLRFAHTYNLEPLVHCATNLISLYATPETKESIKAAAETYSNEHLQKLYDHLCKENSPEESTQKDDDDK